MKLTTLLFSMSFLFFYGCSGNNEYIEIQVKDVIEIKSTFSDADNQNVVYIWSAPTSKAKAVPEFEIKNNIFYFSAQEVGSYKITLNIETESGKEVAVENFNYLAMDFIAKADKKYEPSTFPSKELRQKKIMERPYYTVQVHSKPVKIDAINESNKLFDFGFEDVYIEEYMHNNTMYWRVRTGFFNTKIKANKHKEKISKALKIKLDDLWAVHVK
mgnify:FL=1